MQIDHIRLRQLQGKGGALSNVVDQEFANSPNRSDALTNERIQRVEVLASRDCVGLAQKNPLGSIQYQLRDSSLMPIPSFI